MRILPWSTRAFVSWCLFGSGISPASAEGLMDRSSYDALVSQWRVDNPHLSHKLDHGLIESIWGQVSGTGPQPKVAMAGPINPLPPNDAAPSLNLTSSAKMSKAHEIVAKTIKKASEYNVNHTTIHRNSYRLKPDEQVQARGKASVFSLSTEEKQAAALVAEADAMARKRNGTLHRSYQIPVFSNNSTEPTYRLQEHSDVSKRAPAPYWLAELGAKKPGNLPFGGDSKYKVFRNVKDYGVKGDGTTDDTFGILVAMYDGDRCGADCGGTTVKGATVYFPPGTYLVSSPIIALYNTQIVGHPTDVPVIRAAKSFSGLGVFTSDVYIDQGNGSTWWLNTNNFLRQIRNFIIDVQDVQVNDLKALHWQVAQGTSLQNIHIKMRPNSNHIGLFIENGSGGTIDDISITGGGIGINCGNQQFTSKNIVISGSTVGISMLWDWGWTWQNLIIGNAKYGIQFKTTDFTGGSLIVLDSIMQSVETGISIDQPKDAVSLTVKNLLYGSVGTLIESKASGAILKGGSGKLSNYVLGTAYEGPDYKATKLNGASGPKASIPKIPGLTTDGERLFHRSRPQYEKEKVQLAANLDNDFGNGKLDATVFLSVFFTLSSATKTPVFIPAGSYIVTDTVNIPAGAKIVGMSWSQIVATGDKFSDMKNPRPLVTVGKKGEIGSVEITDLLFTVKGPTAGVVLMEWNLASGDQGSAAMWDSHFRVGGAKGSDLQKGNCPKLSGGVSSKCIAASMMLHLTATSSAYLDNVWAWVADHDLDDLPKSEVQIDIYCARGILIESTGPTWLYGTSSEHSVLYQYALHNANNIFMGMIQTESPYFFPNPPAPKPFESVVGKFGGDPDFKECKDDLCRTSAGLRVVNSGRVFIAGAGLYSWFYNKYDRGCVNRQACQQRLVDVDESSSIIIYSLYTIGGKEMVGHLNKAAVLAKDNIHITQDPGVSIIATYSKQQETIDGSGGLFYEGGPDNLSYGNCDTVENDDYLKWLDWFFQSKYEDRGDDDPWVSQLLALYDGSRGQRCDALYRPNQCSFTPHCDPKIAKTKRNYANAYWAVRVVQNYFNDLLAQKNIVNDIMLTLIDTLPKAITADFSPKEPEKDEVQKIFENIFKALGLGKWGVDKTGASPKVGTFLGDLGTVFSFIDSFLQKDDDKPDPSKLEALLSAALSNVTQISQDTNENAAIAFFGKGSDIHHWKDLGIFPDKTPYHHDVPNFFADGRFLNTVSGEADKTTKNLTRKHIKASMATVALRSLNHYIVGYDDGGKGISCSNNSNPKEIHFDDRCWSIEHPGSKYANVTAAKKSEQIGLDLQEKLVKEYHIDLQAMYKAAASCQAKHNSYNMTVSQEDFNAALKGSRDPLDSSCIFSLPVIYTTASGNFRHESPCGQAYRNNKNGKAGFDYLPDNLQNIFGRHNFCHQSCKDDGIPCCVSDCEGTIDGPDN